MATITLRRVSGLALVATVAALAAPAPLAHADNTTKAITSVSIRIADTKIAPGESGVITATSPSRVS